MTGNKIPSLYLHVPFCASVCFYCDFPRRVYQSEAADRWLDAVEAELAETSVSDELETIYIGGGTPSCLSSVQLDRLLSMLDPYTGHLREYTVECNPELNDEEKISCLAAHGVNRISMGLQTADASLLKTAGRRHSAADVKRLVHQISACGISNISLDLMYGLPGQTMEQLEESVSFALSCSPAHLSLYSLTIEPGSVFGKQGIKPIEEDLEADMYDRICSLLKQAGYLHYEISNFAKPGKESVHNTNVWNYRDFLGIGFGAWGKDETGRYEHASSLNAYCSDPLFKNYTVLTTQEEMFECLMMGLRLKQGISCAVFQERFGYPPDQVFPESISSLERKGLLQRNDGWLSCTERGWPILNFLLVEIMEEAKL